MSILLLSVGHPAKRPDVFWLFHYQLRNLTYKIRHINFCSAKPRCFTSASISFST